MGVFLKRQRSAFYSSAVAALFALVAAIFYLVCASGGYYDDADPIIVVLLLLGIVMLAGAVALGQRSVTGFSAGLLAAVAVGAFMSALMSLVSDRVLSMGFLLFSELGSDNVTAYTYLYLSLAAMGAMLLATILSVFASFGKQAEK